MPKPSFRKLVNIAILLAGCAIAVAIIWSALEPYILQARCLWADNLAGKDPENAEIAYAKLIEDLKSSKNAPITALPNVYEKYGDFAFSHFRFADAMRLYKSGLESAKALTGSNFESGFLQRQAFAQHFQFEREEAPPPDPAMALLALKLRPQENDHPTHHRGNCYRDLGLAYMDRGDYAKADDYFQKSIGDYEAAKVVGFEFDSKSYRIENLIKQKKYADANKMYLGLLASLKDEEASSQLSGNYLEYLRAEEPEIRKVNSHVRRSLRACDFSDLDSYAQTLTAAGTIMPDGLWSVDVFYNALDDVDEGQLNKVWEERLETYKRWIQTRPESDTARVALAWCLASYAWKARGSGWANTVSEQGWKHFRERLAQAEQVLQQVKHRVPNWYRTSQRVALGQGWDRVKYDGLVAESRRTYPTYYAPIFAKAYWILPRWHGAEGEFPKYAEQQATQVSGPNGGDVLYARIAWSLTKRMMANVSDEHMSWPKIKSGLHSIKKQFPASPSAMGLLSLIAIEYGDDKAAESAFAK